MADIARQSEQWLQTGRCDTVRRKTRAARRRILRRMRKQEQLAIEFDRAMHSGDDGCLQRMLRHELAASGQISCTETSQRKQSSTNKIPLPFTTLVASQPEPIHVVKCKWWPVLSLQSKICGIRLEDIQNNPCLHALLENACRQEEHGSAFLQASHASTTTKGEAGRETQSLDQSEDEQQAACEQVEIKGALPPTLSLASNEPADHACGFWTFANQQAHRWPRCRKQKQFDLFLIWRQSSRSH
eukprot:TRINITY_DN10214_c0_g1_i2.p1 TRINITY_DN10214_c0_g1~~TRINITY_DN10214_c0_g1_i2.p1  ORF type:complete len:243 (-),score=42.35 TRINITY_DN10214_c0_g1_i2:30-758(-)